MPTPTLPAPSPAPTKKLLTAAEFAARPDRTDGLHEELVRGEVVPVSRPRFRHSKVQGQIYWLLRHFAEPRQVGHVLMEPGLVTETDPDTVRGPDVAFWSFARLPADAEPDPYPEVAADLVAEVVSPSNTRRELEDKAAEYLRAGVRVVWVVDPTDRTVTAFTRPGEPGAVTPADGTLAAADVLPGFAVPVADLFR